MVKTALQLMTGDRFVDDALKVWHVMDVRRDPFANGPRWIIVRVNDGAGIDTEIACASYEKFAVMDEAVPS